MVAKVRASLGQMMHVTEKVKLMISDRSRSGQRLWHFLHASKTGRQCCRADLGYPKLYMCIMVGPNSMHLGMHSLRGYFDSVD